MAYLFNALLLVLVLVPFLFLLIALDRKAVSLSLVWTAVGLSLAGSFTDWETHRPSLGVITINGFLYIACGVLVVRNKQSRADVLTTTKQFLDNPKQFFLSTLKEFWTRIKQFLTATNKFLLGCCIVLISIFVIGLTYLPGRACIENRKNMDAGIQASNEHNLPAAQEHFLAALSELEYCSKVANIGSHVLFYEATAQRRYDLGMLAPLEALAKVYEAQGQYEKAEPLFRRSLSIEEQSGSPDILKIRTIKKYAALLRMMGRASEAVVLEDRAEAIRQK